MTCRHCGKEIADASRFCKYCGGRQEAAAGESVKEKDGPAPAAEPGQGPAEKKEGPAAQASAPPGPSGEACSSGAGKTSLPSGEASGTPGEASGTPGEASETPGEAPGTPGEAPGRSSKASGETADRKLKKYAILGAVVFVFWVLFLANDKEGVSGLTWFAMVIAVAAAFVMAVRTGSRHRNAAHRDSDNVGYAWAKDMILNESNPSLPVQGYLSEKNFPAVLQPAEPIAFSRGGTVLHGYFFEPDFFSTGFLRRLVTGKKYFAEFLLLAVIAIVSSYLYGADWFTLSVFIFAVYRAATCALRYVLVYYPGLVSMACSPHDLPEGVTEEDAALCICTALRQEGNLKEADGQLLVDGQFPLVVRQGTFHVDFPANVDPQRKSDYFKPLARWNAKAAAALYPDRMKQPLLPILHLRTEMSLGERMTQWAAAAGIVLMLLMLVVYGDLFRTPATDIQDTYWEYSSTQSLGEAFERNFSGGDWEDYTYYGEPYIRFSGAVHAGLLDLYVQIQFRYSEEEESFYLEGATVNDQAVSYTTTQALMQYGFDGDVDELFSSLLAEGIYQGLINALLS